MMVKTTARREASSRPQRRQATEADDDGWHTRQKLRRNPRAHRSRVGRGEEQRSEVIEEEEGKRGLT